MTDLNVTAQLEIDDGDGTSRQFSANDLKAAQTGDSTEATLAAFKAANHADLAELLVLHTDLAAVLAKESADPSTGTGQATQSTKLDTLHTDIAAVLAKITSDPATQTSLAALVAANHTDLAAILAKNEAIRALLASPLLVESASTSKGDDRAISTTTATLLSALVTIPAGATKVLLTPDATLTVSDKHTPSSSVGYRVPASTEWKYDGDSIATLKLYGAANVDCWFFA